VTQAQTASPLDSGLAVARFGAETVQLQVQRDARVAVITIDNPPVNALSQSVFNGLFRLTRKALEDEDVELLVLIGANRRFIAGADISDFFHHMHSSTDSSRAADLARKIERQQEWTTWMESQSKPVVAAMDTFALGGGLEVAMSCHGRVATRRTIVGLPELALGIMPGMGGTQRLPRLVGVRKATEMMMSSASLKADEAKALGLVDEVIEANDPKQLLEAAIRVGKEIVAGSRPFRRTLEMTERLEPQDEIKQIIDAAYRAQQKAFPPNTAVHPFVCLEAIQAGVRSGPTSGLHAEVQAIQECFSNQTCQAMIHAFFAERRTTRLPRVTDQGLQARPVHSVGVVGGGLMGTGIATALLSRGVAVVLKEVSQPLVDGSAKVVAGNIERAVKRGRLTRQQAERLRSMFTPTLSFTDFAGVDVVIEAVVEDLKIKQDVFRQLVQVVRPECLLATNTSTIPIERIASSVEGSAHRLLGLHFFSPAQAMPLVEIVRTREVSTQAIVDALGLVKTLRKTPIVVGSCPGFTVNRVFFPIFQAASLLINCGVDPYRIDRALMRFGLPMGAFRLGDLVGIDVSDRVNATYAEAWPDRVYSSDLTSLMIQAARLGQKTGKGWYTYSTGKADEDPNGIGPVLLESRRRSGLPARAFDDQEIVELALFPVVNEACRVVEEGIVVHPADVDIGSILGYSFPRYRGGVLKWADTMSSAYIRDRLAAWDAEFGPLIGSRFFAPSNYLRLRADKGLPLSLNSTVPAPAACKSTGSSRDVVVVAAVRTPIGKAKRGLLRDTQADDLLAPALAALATRLHQHSMPPGLVGDVVVGGIMATIGQLRSATLLAGFPVSVPVKKVDRLCSSGLQAVADVAMAIHGGLYDCAIAAGVESMSTGVRAPTPPNPKAAGNELLQSVYLPMGTTSENVAARYRVSREQQDRIGYRSQKLAAAAQAEGRWREEIVPVATTVKDKNGQPQPVVLDKDEGVRPETSLEGLAKLKPSFSASGSSTAGNSSQVSDGASAVLLMTRALAEAYSWEVLGTFRSFASVGCDPAVMGIGPALAIPKALEKAGLSLADVDLFEINEAFASQFLYCLEELSIPLEKVNVNGGAIALGHPLGCTGARLTTTLLHEMRRCNVRYGVVSMCVGTGMGAAAVFENC